MGHISRLHTIWPALLGAALVLGNCKKPDSMKEPPPAAAPLPAAAALPAPATAAAADVSPTAALPPEASPSAPPAPTASISPFIDAGPGSPSGLPLVGKPAKIAARPVNQLGRGIEAYEPVFGAQMLLVAMRYDLNWTSVMLANDLTPENKFTHAFNVTFPHAGRHVLYFIFQPKGGQVTMVPLDVTVLGTAAPGEEWPDSQREFAGPAGLKVALALDKEEITPCQSVHVATSWLRKGKQIALQGADNQPRVYYLGVAENMGRLAIGKPAVAAGGEAEQLAASATATALISVPAIGGDMGSDALLKFENIGHHKILAVADVGTAKAPQLTTVWFAVTVKGAYPEAGCP